MSKRIYCFLFVAVLMMVFISGCGINSKTDPFSANANVEVTLFAAKSLNSSLDEIISLYAEDNPSVMIRTNYDSSGTLMTQIIEGGATCDVFLSASPKQVDELEEEGMTIKDTRSDLLKNQMCVVTFPGSGTQVSGLLDMGKAKSLAIAAESVPIGSYTRKALVNAGLISIKDKSGITSIDISDALGGVEINECSNVGAVVAAVAEQSNEVGTVYYSDIYGYEDKLQILETVPEDLSGEIVYPVVQVSNAEASDAERAEALKFIEFLNSEKAKAVFEKHKFIMY